MSRKNKVDIPDDLKTKCNVIIHGASTASAAACAGIAQIPLADQCGFGSYSDCNDCFRCKSV